MSLDLTQVQTISAIIMAVATAILVIVTGYYAREVKKSREDIRKLEKERIEREEKRKKEEIGQLRKLIFMELVANREHMKNFLQFAKKLKKYFKQKKENLFKIEEMFIFRDIAGLLLVEHPVQDIVYENILNRIALLPKEETYIVIQIYTNFRTISQKYAGLIENLKISSGYVLIKKDMEKIIGVEEIIEILDGCEKLISSTMDLIECWFTFYKDKNFSKFQKGYDRILTNFRRSRIQTK